MERRLISDPMISCCLKSVLPCNLVQFSKFVLGCSLKSARHYFILSLLTDRYNNRICNNNPEEEEEEEHHHQHHDHDHDHDHHHHQESTQSNCDRHEKETEMITCDDIDMDTVMSSIGIEEWRNVHKQNKDLIREAHEFLDSKDASLEELKEAFYVFDRNEDGFITAFELWSMLRRLEMKEGMRYEDCEEMIRVYDKDGDGRINFSEFKDMMEQAL